MTMKWQQLNRILDTGPKLIACAAILIGLVSFADRAWYWWREDRSTKETIEKRVIPHVVSSEKLLPKLVESGEEMRRLIQQAENEKLRKEVRRWKLCIDEPGSYDAAYCAELMEKYGS